MEDGCLLRSCQVGVRDDRGDLMPKVKTYLTMSAALAALSLSLSPVTAAENPTNLPGAIPDHVPATVQIEKAGKAQHRRYRDYRYRRGPGLGDVVAGVLIVGAIAHIAKAATRGDGRDGDPDYRHDSLPDYDGARGIDRAVDMCVDAVERERRVETVDMADRNAAGWIVEGTVSSGDSFTCRIDQDGRNMELDFGSQPSGGWDGQQTYGRGDGHRQRVQDYEDRQYGDDRYVSEWSRVDNSTSAIEPSVQPAFPGGPIKGDEEIDGDLEIGTGYPGAGA